MMAEKNTASGETSKRSHFTDEDFAEAEREALDSQNKPTE